MQLIFIDQYLAIRRVDGSTVGCRVGSNLGSRWRDGKVDVGMKLAMIPKTEDAASATTNSY